MADAEAHYPAIELPAGTASDEHWATFKARAFDELVARVQQVDRRLGSYPHRRIERIREIRREHHLIVIGDRIRRASASPCELSGPELRNAAEYVLDRTAYLASKSAEWTEPRSRLEENMMMSARVSWHKLMRRAGSRAELRGGSGIGRPEFHGISAIFKKISAPGVPGERRAKIFGDYVEQRIQQLVHLAREVAATTDCKLASDDRVLIADLEKLLRRIRYSNQERELSRKSAGTRRRRAGAGRAASNPNP